MNNAVLSWVITGRNDSYMGNYAYRLQTTLNILAANLLSLGFLDEIEVILVDWGSEEKLSDILELSPEASSILRVIHVPRETTLKISPDGSFHTSCAVNAGIRRARGEYVMLSDSDCMIPRQGLDSLLKLLKGIIPAPKPLRETFWYLKRYQIPWEICERRPSIEMWPEILARLASSIYPEAHGCGCWGGAAAAQLMHRDIWHEMRGYDESYRLWGFTDQELMLRLSQRYDWLDLQCVGTYAMHMQHGPSEAKVRSVFNPWTVNEPFAVNNADWGLGTEIFEEYSVKKTTKANDQDYLPLQGHFIDPQKWPKLLEDPNVMQRIANTLGSDLPQGDDFASLLILVSHLIHEKPLNFFQVGSPLKWQIEAVLKTSPGISYYLFARWKKGSTEESRASHLNIPPMMRKCVFRGYARVLTGDCAESFSRLERSEKYVIECGLISGVMIEENFPAITKQVTDRMCRGAVVVCTELSDQQQAVLVQSCSPHIDYRPLSPRMGFLVSI